MVKKRGRKFQFNLSNRFLYTFIAIAVIISLGIVVYALAPGVAPNPGHTLSEVAPPAGCTSGQVLSWDGSSWVCVSVTGGGGMVFGNWEIKTINTVYQASTDGFAVTFDYNINNLRGFTDSSNPPTTARVRIDTSTSNPGITMPVRKNDYWKIEGAGSAVVYWIPIISGGGNFIPIIPVTFTQSPTVTWTALDLSSAIPAGTKEVGGYIRYQSPGGMGLVSIASKSDSTGEKSFVFLSDVPGYNIATTFRLSLSEDRKLYYKTDAAAPASSMDIVISEYK